MRVRERLAELLPGEDPDQLMRGRYAIFNVWRPTNGPVEQWPVAVCDMQSMRPDDFVDAELRWPHRTGHVCAVQHNPAHRRLYVPAMDVGEALVFKQVHHGIVTLTGTVAGWAKRVAARDAARRVAGGRDVADDLRGQPYAPSTPSDTAIITKLFASRFAEKPTFQRRSPAS